MKAHSRSKTAQQNYREFGNLAFHSLGRNLCWLVRVWILCNLFLFQFSSKMFPTNSASSVQNKRINSKVQSDLVKCGWIWMIAHKSMFGGRLCSIFFPIAETARPFICHLQEGPLQPPEGFYKIPLVSHTQESVWDTGEMKELPGGHVR